MADLPLIAATAWAHANAHLADPVKFGRALVQVYCAARDEQGLAAKKSTVLHKPTEYELAAAKNKAAIAVVLSDRASATQDPLVRVRLLSESNLAFLDSELVASRLRSSSEHPSGASDV